LALDHNPVNLGQGFPDFAAPDYVTKSLSAIATGENVLLNQYTRGFVSSDFTDFCTVSKQY
jgi:kynurenine--oxoglutarate transaminase/cysteine-S-conjugate beta-lyase/glutamine--phenylpyruvate transaminase